MNFTENSNCKQTYSPEKLSKIEYDSKIEKTQENIIYTLKDIKSMSNEIGKEVNKNTESIKRINDGLNELDHNLSSSEYIVKRFSSWFSYFRSVNVPEPFVKEQSMCSPSLTGA